MPWKAVMNITNAINADNNLIFLMLVRRLSFFVLPHFAFFDLLIG